MRLTLAWSSSSSDHLLSAIAGVAECGIEDFVYEPVQGFLFVVVPVTLAGIGLVVWTNEPRWLLASSAVVFYMMVRTYRA